MQQIDRGIFYEDAYPGVTLGAIILPQGTILVDAPLRAEDARAWLSQLYHLGSKNNRVLVNLDAHPDRSLGARSMECTIIAHQKTAQVFRGRPSIFKGQNAESGSEWETYDEMVGTRWALPDITFTQRLTIHWGDPEAIIDHHPGAAPGGAWVIVPDARVVFVGDVVLPNQPLFLTNADIPAWIETLDVLLNNYRDYAIISGRGGPAPVDLVVKQQQHLKHILKGLERLAKRNAGLHAVEDLIPGLLNDLTFEPELRETYVQRYRHGLYQYYAHHYRPSDLISE
ncbi:MAG TPA: MBL fold metallo-hydrolase [Anaerolineales bacterium]|nr:MBL fold metallo-hydrolase [Anaerolineales bacterium]